MSNPKKRTGLGTQALFQEAESQPTPEPPPTTQLDKSTKSAKVRTTITLYPETLTQLDLLKIHARQAGEKATYSDILQAAIEALVEKKGISSA